MNKSVYDQTKEFTLSDFIVKKNLFSQKGDLAGIELVNEYIERLDYESAKKLFNDIKMASKLAAYETEKVFLYEQFINLFPNGERIYNDMKEGKYRDREQDLQDLLWTLSGMIGKIPTNLNELKEIYMSQKIAQK